MWLPWPMLRVFFEFCDDPIAIHITLGVQRDYPAIKTLFFIAEMIQI
jgi:hypothetical protein